MENSYTKYKRYDEEFKRSSEELANASGRPMADVAEEVDEKRAKHQKESRRDRTAQGINFGKINFAERWYYNPLVKSA